MSVAPVLVFGWGNPSRGDDALGPLFVEAIEALDLPGVECLTDFQLQVEHALDLCGRQRVLFVDACVTKNPSAPDGARLSPLLPARGVEYTTHALHPQSLLQVYATLGDGPPPCAWLLEIPGHSWDLGEPLSPQAAAHLHQAMVLFQEWFQRPSS